MDLDNVTLLAQQIRETNKLSRENAEHLKSLRIQLKNPVLPQHEIETRAGSRPPTREEIKKFKEIGSIKKGCYNTSEDKIIAHNWKEFCKLHHWNPTEVEPFLLLRDENKTYIRSKRERKRFVQFLADGLPKRTLYSVYHRFRTLYADNFQRRFNPEEDRMILDHLEHNVNLNHKRKYADLAKVLKRTRISIWRRYRILKRRHHASENY